MTSKTEDILRPLNDVEVENLLILLKKCLPESIVIYNWILKHREWSAKVPDMKIKILCPDTDFTTGGVAVAICSGLAEKMYGVVFATVGNDERLKKCLMETTLIPWEGFTHFTGVLERHALIMSYVLKSKGFRNTENEISQSFLLHIPIEKALQQEIPRLPDNFLSSPVDITQMPEAVNIWDGYKKTVEKMFQLNLSSGVFRKNEGSRKELVAMNVQAEYGGISILQTNPCYQRQGFGTVVLTILTKLMAEQGVHPHGHVKKDNLQSLGLFKKCGYEVLGKSYWIFIEKSSN